MTRARETRPVCNGGGGGGKNQAEMDSQVSEVVSLPLTSDQVPCESQSDPFNTPVRVVWDKMDDGPRSVPA